MKKYFLAVALFAAFPLTTLAHHGHTSQFDTSRPVKIAGTVTDIGWINPHAYVYLDVANEDGSTTNWHCEMRASSVANRSGWSKEMFATGTPIEIIGVMSRKEDNGCYVETIAFNGLPPIERYATDIQESDWNPQAAGGSDEDVELVRPARTAWGAPYIGGDWAAEQRLAGAVSDAVAQLGGAANAPGVEEPGGMGAPGAGGPPRRRGSTIELTEAGIAAQAELPALDSLGCQPRDFFSDWTFDQPSNRIIQEEDKIILMYGFMDTIRTIHLDMDEHPEDMGSSWAGHSIGYWDGDVLVVDTKGFTAFSGRRGAIRSDEYHTIERFSLDYEAGSLTRAYSATDSLFWAEGQQQTGEDVVFYADFPYEPYACDDRTVE